MHTCIKSLPWPYVLRIDPKFKWVLCSSSWLAKRLLGWPCHSLATSHLPPCPLYWWRSTSSLGKPSNGLWSWSQAAAAGVTPSQTRSSLWPPLLPELQVASPLTVCLLPSTLGLASYFLNPCVVTTHTQPRSADEFTLTSSGGVRSLQLNSPSSRRQMFGASEV